MTGTRQARPTFLHKVASHLLSARLTAFVAPEVEIAAAEGLDLESAGLDLTVNPRHATILVIVGPLPAELVRAASVVYAQMPRPRWILAIGQAATDPLPAPDVTVQMDQDAVNAGVEQLRQLIRSNSFGETAEDYVAETLVSRTQFTCPMHPEVIQDEPGTCPICGMDLVAQESIADSNAGHSHHDQEPLDHGASHGAIDMADAGQEHEEHASGGHRHEHDDHRSHGHDHKSAGGSGGHDHAHEAPHEHVEHSGRSSGHEDHDSGGEHSHNHTNSHDSGHDEHAGHDGFMSMIAMTRDLPRSPDGLPMEWIEVPFGPLFPGVPAGLRVNFTLDGDAVAEARIAGCTGAVDDFINSSLPVEQFVDRISQVDRLAPGAYRVLALRALADAGAVENGEALHLHTTLLLERQRLMSHLVWLSRLGTLLGVQWLRTSGRELAVQVRFQAPTELDEFLASTIEEFVRGTRRIPLLRSRLAGVGVVDDATLSNTTGPVERAGGDQVDVRTSEDLMNELGFESSASDHPDAWGRLNVRIDELRVSARLIRLLAHRSLVNPIYDREQDGLGRAHIETPRGAAKLRVQIDSGYVSEVELVTPSRMNLEAGRTMLLGREVADALVSLHSLDISPWELAT